MNKKEYNIFSNEEYKHDNLFIEKCTSINHVCAAKCYEMEHEF